MKLRKSIRRAAIGGKEILIQGAIFFVIFVGVMVLLVAAYNMLLENVLI